MANRNSILGLRAQAISIKNAVDAPITPLRVGTLFNDIIDYLPLESNSNAGSSGTLPTTSGVSSIWSINPSGLPIAGYVLNGIPGEIYLPSDITATPSSGLNEDLLWKKLTNAEGEFSSVYENTDIHEKHLGNVSKFFLGNDDNLLKKYRWWGRPLSGTTNSDTLTVTGDLKGGIGTITFNKTFNGTPSEVVLELQADNTLKVTGNIWATGFVSALGTSTLGGNTPSSTLGNFLDSLNRSTGLNSGVAGLDSSKDGWGLVWGSLGGTPATYGWKLAEITGNGTSLNSSNWAYWFDEQPCSVDSYSTSQYLCYNDGTVSWDDDLFTRMGTVEAGITNLNSSMSTLQTAWNTALSNFITRSDAGFITTVSDAVNSYLGTLNIANGVNPNTTAALLNDTSLRHSSLSLGYLHYNGSSFEWIQGAAITTILGKTIGGSSPDTNGQVLMYNGSTWGVGEYIIGLNGASTANKIDLGTFYAPTQPGTNTWLLLSNGDGAAPTWVNPSSITVGSAVTALSATSASTAATADTATIAGKLSCNDKSIWGLTYIDDGVPQTVTGTPTMPGINFTNRAQTLITSYGNILYNIEQQGSSELGWAVKNSRLDEDVLLAHTSGVVKFPKGELGISIGKARLIWEESTNSLKIQNDIDGTPVNFYATGGVAALGIPNNLNGSVANANIVTLANTTLNNTTTNSTTVNSTTVNATTVNTTSEVIGTGGDASIEYKTAGDETNETTHSLLTYTVPVTGANPVLEKTVLGNNDIDEVHGLRFYFDADHYLYIDGNKDLIYHKGDSGDKNITLNL